MNAFSAEKLLIDDEIVGMLRRLRAGFEVSAETLALDVIATVGPGGNFLLEEHTVAHCRDGQRPSFFNRRNRDAWERLGSPDLVRRAEVAVKDRLAAYVAPEMDPAVRRRLAEYVGALVHA